MKAQPKGQLNVKRIRSIPHGFQKPAVVNALPEEAFPILLEGYRQNHVPVSLESNELALARPEWAGFQMEQAYWSVMHSICRKENITEDNFVILAKSRCPDLRPAAAVQVEIIQYLRRQSGRFMQQGTFAVSPLAEPPISKIRIRTLVALNVLVVDDLDIARDIAGSILRAAGHQVTCVEGGLQAIAAVETINFNVVLMDVLMPEMDGLETTRCIRELEGVRGRIPIVALTAQVLPEHVAECREVGMNSHVPKPFGPKTLLTAVLRAAAMGQSADVKQ